MTDKKQKITIITICIVGIIVISIGSILFYNLGSKSNNIAEFQTYLNEYQASSQKYILGKNESVYTDLINESLSVIAKKDANKTVQLTVKLKELQEKIVAENTGTLNGELKKIKGIDISKLSDIKKKKITSALNVISTLISNKNFTTCSTKLGETRTMINNEVKLIVDAENKKLAKLAEETAKNKNIAKLAEETAKNKKLTLDNTVDQNNDNSLGQLSSSEALKKVQQAYPDYIYIDGGSIDEAFNDAKGIDEPAYVFKFTNDGNMDIYVAWVFADGGIKFRLAGNRNQQ